MAWVFLAEDLVFKLKKPVRYPYLDFSTVDRREFACREEVRLNGRLAPDVYLGAVPLTSDEHGQLQLGGSGETLDWLVKMKRLPSDRMLETMIARGLGPEDLTAVTDLLMHFYGHARREVIQPDEFWRRFVQEYEANAQVLSDRRFELDRNTTDTTLSLMKQTLCNLRPEIETRAAGGHIVEGHGDLRPEHIFLTTPPAIIDCLEFNRDLRLVDPFDEITFLGLECERLGALWIESLIMTRLRAELSPGPSSQIIAFYRAARALLRARLALAHLTEPNPRLPQKWEPRARAYITIAFAASKSCSMGTG
jgi:aminoglycoside phosphotransferase family enzyme